MSDITRPQRPPLAERLQAGLEETLEWAKGTGSARITEVEDGNVSAPAQLTRAEWEARRTKRNKTEQLTYDAARDTLSIRFAATSKPDARGATGIVPVYDSDGVIIGMDLYQASRRTPHLVEHEAA